jgi:hypothetical protein
VARINCLHCDAPLRTRSSRKVVATSVQLNLQCTNFDCGATFGGVFEITHGIFAGAMPNPAVQLRMAPPRRLQTPAHDGHFAASAPEVAPLRAANDDGVDEAVNVGT